MIDEADLDGDKEISFSGTCFEKPHPSFSIPQGLIPNLSAVWKCRI